MSALLRGVLKAYAPGSWRATVLIEGAVQQNISDVPVNQGLNEAALVIGRRVAVLAFDERNQRDGVIVAVYS